MMNSVLVIESNARTRTALHELLTLHWPHLAVYTAENGPKGLHLAFQKRPDLILIDGELPGLNGYQTAKVLRHLPETRAIPLIALTTNAQTVSSKSTGLRKACDAYLIKPFAADKLFGMMASLSSPNGNRNDLGL